MELGPALGPRYPLLTDVQIVRLLCEGCPFPRPHPDALATYLSEIELDVHDPAAQMRAILCADIFHEWRAGSYVWRERAGLPLGAQPGLGCRLAHCRATMGRLIAGLNVHMFPQGPGPREAIVYADDAVPADGFTPPASATAPFGTAPEPASTAGDGGPAPARVRPGPQPATAGPTICAPAAARVPPPACPILPVAPPGRPGAAGWPPVFSPLTRTGPRRGCAGAPAHGPAPVAVFDGSRLCLPETGPFPPYTPRGTATPAVRLVQRSSVRSALQPAKSTS